MSSRQGHHSMCYNLLIIIIVIKFNLIYVMKCQYLCYWLEIITSSLGEFKKVLVRIKLNNRNCSWQHDGRWKWRRVKCCSVSELSRWRKKGMFNMKWIPMRCMHLHWFFLLWLHKSDNGPISSDNYYNLLNVICCLSSSSYQNKLWTVKNWKSSKRYIPNEENLLSPYKKKPPHTTLACYPYIYEDVCIGTSMLSQAKADQDSLVQSGIHNSDIKIK